VAKEKTASRAEVCEVTLLTAIAESEAKVLRDLTFLKAEVQRLSRNLEFGLDDLSGGKSSKSEAPCGDSSPRKVGGEKSTKSWFARTGSQCGTCSGTQSEEVVAGEAEAWTKSVQLAPVRADTVMLQSQSGNNAARYWHSWPMGIPLRNEYSLNGSTLDSIDTLRSAALRFGAKTVKPVMSSVGMFEHHNQTGFFGMIRPDSERRMAMDALSFFMLIFDVIFTPYYITWPEAVPDRTAVPIMIATSSFWALDMILSFFTGFFTDEGLVELHFRRVAAHYLKTWFLPDFICSAADASNLLPIFIGHSPSSASSLVRFVRIVRLARFLRVLGMLRMLRVLQAFSLYMESALSQSWGMVIRILQICGLLVWLGHLVACAWFGIGLGAPQGEVCESWMQTPIGLDQQFDIKTLGPAYQYVLSYQWGLAQLTLGSHDVIPLNISERIFTILCNLFGLVFGGTLISILSTTLIDLKEVNQEKASKVRVLKAFLLQHQIDRRVRLRILHQVRDRVSRRDGTLVEKDVKALQLLSSALLRDLRYSLYVPRIRTHALFRAWGCVDTESLRHLCGEEGVEFLSYLPDDEIFSGGDLANAGYLLTSGTVDYDFEARSILAGLSTVHSPEVVDAWPSESMLVSEDTWMCEATWWVVWYHVGTATSKGPSTLLSISPDAIAGAVGTNVTLQAITQEYARMFSETILHAWGTSYQVPTDVEVRGAHLEELIFHMPSEVHIILGMASLDRSLHVQKVAAPTSNVMKLEEEIRECRAIILMDEAGALRRQVALVVLSIEREDSPEVLAEIAVYDGSDQSWNPRCRLPGTKQHFEETPQLALSRLVTAHLDCMTDELPTSVDHYGFTPQIDQTPSKQYGIGTTYYKSIFSTLLTEEHLTTLTDDFAHSTSGVTLNRAGMDSKEALLRSLEDVREVYILAGEDQVALYAWLDRSTIKDLMHQEEVLSGWVNTLVQQCLPPTAADQMAVAHGVIQEVFDVVC